MGVVVGGIWGKIKLGAMVAFVAVMGLGLWQAGLYSEIDSQSPHQAEMANSASDLTFTTSTVVRASADGRTHTYISRPVFGDDVIDSDIQTFIDEQKALRAVARREEREAGVNASDRPIRELNIIFDLAFETEDYIAFSFELGHYVGDQGTSRTHTRIYDKATGKRLLLGDLFLPRSDYVEEISTHVVADLKLQAEIRLDRFFSAADDKPSTDQELRALYKNIESEGLLADTHNADFALTRDGALVFAFPESLVDPKREGIVQARVELDSYSDFLTPAFRQAVTQPETMTFETRSLEPVFVAAAGDVAAEDGPATAPDCAVEKCVALTFDDGPGNHTSRLLDTLAENNVPATFFLVGHRVKFHTEDVKRMIVDGHEIGNHSWSHPRLIRLSDAQVRDQIQRTNDVLKVQTGVEPALFRPPYGEFNTRVLNQIGMPVILWNHDTWDWRVLNAEIVAQRTANVTKSGSIVLLHDIHRTTVDAMPEAIADLRNQGYTFVTISQLFAPRVPETQQIYSQR